MVVPSNGSWFKETLTDMLPRAKWARQQSVLIQHMDVLKLPKWIQIRKLAISNLSQRQWISDLMRILRLSHREEVDKEALKALYLISRDSRRSSRDLMLILNNSSTTMMPERGSNLAIVT